MNIAGKCGPGVRKPEGFTRLDLLGILSILSILALLNVAAVSDNRRGSAQAVCLSNLKELTRAWQEFAVEQNRFMPNPDDTYLGLAAHWAAGDASLANPYNPFNSGNLQNPKFSVIAGYLPQGNLALLQCPASPLYGPYSGPDLTRHGSFIPAVRSYSINAAVGTDPYAPSNGELASNGPWLDNNYTHTRGKTWRTYGRFGDIVSPTPDHLAAFLDEDENSINDGASAFGMEKEEWIDWPATRHNRAGTLSFADGHAQLRHWVDARTAVYLRNTTRLAVPGSPDYQWLHERISARIRP